MDEQTAPDTRSRILESARALFLEQGYEQTSLRQIAVRLDLSKAAILYHFSTKAQILATLVQPMLEAGEAALGTAEKLEPEAARWAAVEGLLDAILPHVSVLRIAEGWWTAREPLLHRVMDLNTRAVELIAGPGAGLRERVRAAGVITLLARPAILHPEVPLDEVRDEVLAAARQLFADLPPLDGAPAPAARRGRRSALTGEKLAEARRMYAAGTHTVDEIAARLGVSRATVYRHLRDPVADGLYSETS